MHRCEFNTPSDNYGPAITECWEEDDELWVGNGEYYSQVNFCPFCGYKVSKSIYRPERPNPEDVNNFDHPLSLGKCVEPLKYEHASKDINDSWDINVNSVCDGLNNMGTC